MKPELKSVRLGLYPAAVSDLDFMIRLLRQEEVRRYLCDGATLTKDEVEAFLGQSDLVDVEGLGLWILRLRATNDPLGLVGLMPVNPLMAVRPSCTGGIEPVIALLPSNWGQGIATEALDRICGHAFASLRIDRLIAGVDRPNLRSHRLLARCGFVPIDEVSGLVHPLDIYGLIRPDAVSPDLS